MRIEIDIKSDSLWIQIGKRCLWWCRADGLIIERKA